ncbi:MAG: DUF3737 family protein [Actinomycetia bacterium]|nr:DUF3737 family protein [Actinomycetes bacterium]
MPHQRIEDAHLTGERALFQARQTSISGTTFSDGESPLKHVRDIRLDSCVFGWKYPLWYATGVTMDRSALLDTARSGIWYTRDITITRSLIAAPKTFRRSRGITLEHVELPNATETLWSCEDVTLRDVSANGDYVGMNASRVRATDLRVNGNYLFDGGSDIEIDGGVLLSKDAFWNCRDVTVRNCLVIGEYLGWNSTRVTFDNCVIESLQGLCYIDGLVLRDCRLVNTTLAFEYSTVDATLDSTVDSVINPAGGVIRSHGIGELIQDDPALDHAATRFETITPREDHTP